MNVEIVIGFEEFWLVGEKLVEETQWASLTVWVVLLVLHCYNVLKKLVWF